LRLLVSSPQDAYVTVVEFPEDVPVTDLRVDGKHPPGGPVATDVQVTSYAPGDEPLELAFTVPAGAPLHLQLRTNITGLPPLESSATPAPPAHAMPMAPWTVRTRLQRAVEF